MGAKRKSLLALAALSVFVTLGTLSASAQADQDTPQPRALSAGELSEQNAESAYFSKTLALALTQRPSRLVSADDFLAMQSLKDAIILDTRSAEAYAKSHLRGAVSLPLTDMTELSLALTLPSRTMPILIYSDQNFGTVPGPITHDSSDLSLNLLSFLALTQYGYENVFELGERLAAHDPRYSWESTEITAQMASSRLEATGLN